MYLVVCILTRITLYWQEQHTISFHVRLQENQRLYSCLAETQSHHSQSCWNQLQGIGEIVGVIWKMDLLIKLYLLTAENVKRAREGWDPTQNYNTEKWLNRIVVRDEKGNETLRRASHLKACDLKQKVASMTPEQEEYDKFGRSIKLLIHPKDIPDLQFDGESRVKGEILPNTEISMIEVNITWESPESRPRWRHGYGRVASMT